MTDTVTHHDTDAEPEIDRELLAEAQRHLDGAWPNEVINKALLDYVEAWRERRGRAFDRLQQIAEEGDLDWAAVERLDE